MGGTLEENAADCQDLGFHSEAPASGASGLRWTCQWWLVRKRKHHQTQRSDRITVAAEVRRDCTETVQTVHEAYHKNTGKK